MAIYNIHYFFPSFPIPTMRFSHSAYATEQDMCLKQYALYRDTSTRITSLFYFENLQNERNPQAKCYAVFQPVVLTGLTGLTGLHFVICFQIRSWVLPSCLHTYRMCLERFCGK